MQKSKWSLLRQQTVTWWKQLSEDAEFWTFFEEIFTCAEYGSKRKPEIYKSAADFLGTAPEDTWVFEDAFHGAETAAKAGFQVLGIRDPSEENQQGLQSVSQVYLTDFQHSEPFWDFVSL